MMTRKRYCKITDILTLGDLYQQGFGFDWLTIVQFNPQALLVGLFIDNELADWVVFERRTKSVYSNFIFDLEVSTSYRG
jgi:hypothetical protein